MPCADTTRASPHVHRPLLPVHVDTHRRQVTVEAGATVSKVLEHLRPYGLTLENLASINEQQLGGFIQVSAHGSGASVP